jgi:deazaflavin-dependent oxidoreductase (nitroreductase family)
VEVMPGKRYDLMKIFWQIHLKLYLWSSGRLVRTIRGLPVLLLTTTGKKTGLPRTKVLMYLPYGKDFAVIASNLGEDNHPAWWINLKAEPTATVQIGKEQFTVRAREVEGYEREKIWKALAEINSDYEQYRRWTSRRIPVVVLERQ